LQNDRDNLAKNADPGEVGKELLALDNAEVLKRTVLAAFPNSRPVDPPDQEQ
jgi:hypothetical protein